MEGLARKLHILAIIFILLSISSRGINAQHEWHVYPGDSIQDAIDNASLGDTIYVHAGTYTENVVVNKPDISLIGDGRGLVTVKAKNSMDHTFHVTADGVTVTGFTVTGSYVCQYAGICIQGANNCKILNNSCKKNLCAGIFLKSSNNCSIVNNIVSDNDCGGIKLAEYSTNNTIKDNILENNVNVNLDIYGESKDNLIYNNYFGSVGNWGNVIDETGKNRWNISKTPGTSIVGGPYLGGNYFGDYNGTDADGDGFGDIPYDIKDNTGEKVMDMDYLPLVEQPILSYEPKFCDFEGMIKGETASVVFEIWNSGSGTLAFSLNENCDWIDVNPTSGTSAAKRNTITVSIDTTNLSSGIHVCPINISSNGGNDTFTVTCDILFKSEKTPGFEAVTAILGLLIVVPLRKRIMKS